MGESDNDAASGDASDSPRVEYARPMERRRATRDIVTGTICLLFVTMGIAGMFVPSISRCRPAANRIKSAFNLKQIGMEMEMYANAHNHEYPESLVAILAIGDLTPETFVSPLGNDTPATGPATQAVLADFTKPGRCSYLYFGAGLSDTGDPNTVTAHEVPQPNEPGMDVLFLDGHVEFVPNPAAQQLRAALAAGPVAWTSTGGITRPATQPTTGP